MPRERWDPCVSHSGSRATHFVRTYFTPERSVLLIGGGGFDPRSTRVPELLSSTGAGYSEAVFLQEERGGSRAIEEKVAEEHIEILRSHARARVEPVRIFADDGAVIGGREAVKIIRKVDLSASSDVVVDLSALSKGVAFPVVRYLLEKVDSGQVAANLHVVVLDHAQLDNAIIPIASDKVQEIHGFGGGRTLLGKDATACLWMPQLVAGQREVLERIYDRVDPDEVCPIVPFPSLDPRTGDLLLHEFKDFLENRWAVSSGGLIYASEQEPLNLYRSILNLHRHRSEVLGEIREPLTVLSPTGSKVLSLGALMAALEWDLPLVHVEAVGYTVDWECTAINDVDSALLVHVCLGGKLYPANWQELKL